MVVEFIKNRFFQSDNVKEIDKNRDDTINIIALLNHESHSSEIVDSYTREKAERKNLFDKKIQLDLNINKSLIGGIRLHIDNKIYDSSIITQLNKMKQSFIKR